MTFKETSKGLGSSKVIKTESVSNLSLALYWGAYVQINQNSFLQVQKKKKSMLTDYIILQNFKTIYDFAIACLQCLWFENPHLRFSSFETWIEIPMCISIWIVPSNNLFVVLTHEIIHFVFSSCEHFLLGGNFWSNQPFVWCSQGWAPEMDHDFQIGFS